eukprot:5515000-Prymnesium_polylepis.1
MFNIDTHVHAGALFKSAGGRGRSRCWRARAGTCPPRGGEEVVCSGGTRTTHRVVPPLHSPDARCTPPPARR